MHVLDPERPAVGVSQRVEDFVEGRHVLAGQAVGHEVPGQVPDGQPVVERVELGMELGRLGVQRVEVGDQVATHPVHVDERLDMDLLQQTVVLTVGRVVRPQVLLPTNRLVGDLERLEDLVVEAVLAHQAFGNISQEEAGLGPLDDAVVIGGRESDCLADAQIGQRARVGRLESRREAQRADADDEALAGHEAGHRLHGPEGARVGQGHRGPGEVVRGDLVGVNLSHQLLVGADEPPEVELVGSANARHHKGPGAPRLLDIDSQSEADVMVANDPRGPLAVGVGHESGVHGRGGYEPLHHGVADQVGEADLAPVGSEELVVDHGAVDLEQLGRHHSHTCGRRDAQGRLHVGDDAGGRPPQRRGFVVVGAPTTSRRHGGLRGDRRAGTCGDGGGRNRSRRWRGRRSGSRSLGGQGRRRNSRRRLDRRRTGWPIVGEELPPRVGDRGRIGAESVVHVLDQPRIRTEGASSGRTALGVL